MSAQTLSCTYCGYPYTLYPPDSTFKKLLIKPCSDNEGNPDHNFKITYQCVNCDARTDLYWCPGHFYFVSGRGVNANRNSRAEGMEGLSRGRYGRESLFD